MSQGFQSRLGIDTATPVTKGYDFSDTCELALSGENVDASGIRGLRERQSERVRQGLLRIAGAIAFTPSLADLEGAAGLMQWILGGTPSSGSYPISDSLSPRYVTIDKVTKVCTYPGVIVNKATLQSSEGTPLKLTLDLIGTTETVDAAGTFPSGSSISYNLDPPLMHFDAVLTMLGSSRQVKSFTLTLDNMIDAKFYNSQSATALQTKDRKITLDCQVPYTAENADLYNQGVAGASATLAVSYASSTLQFTLGALQVPPQGPTIPGRDEILLPISGEVRSVGQGTGGYVPSLVVTLPS